MYKISKIGLMEAAEYQVSVDYESDVVPERDSQTYKAPKLKALIVDDVPVNRLVTRQMLKSNFECKEAENGEQAVHYYTQDQPDLILMDISMPVMNGVEALKKIRQMNTKDKPVPIIAVTTGGPYGSREELMEEGFSEFIEKPLARKELFAKIAFFLPNTLED